MTEASTGLRKALARNASVSKLSAEELLAQMSEEQKASLAATLAPPVVNASDASAADAEDDDDDLEMADKKKAKKKDGDEYMGDDKAKAATDRAIAVMSSEHFAGREAQATKLLGNDKLSADEIVSLLADMTPAASGNDEAEALAAMKAALADNKPAGIEANDGGSKTTPASEANAVWAFATAKVFGNNKAA